MNHKSWCFSVWKITTSDRCLSDVDC